MVKKKHKITIDDTLPYVIIICATLGLIAAFSLTYDKIQVLKNPAYDPSCNINPILSCGSVMKTEQASLLGVPNTIFGIMSFSSLITFGVLILAGGKFKKWVWQAAQLAATLGLVFVIYLFFQGIFRINAICPWCFLTWIITIPIFIYVTSYNLAHDNIPIPTKINRVSGWFQKNNANILITSYAIIFVILLQHFWYYWKTLM